MGQIPGELYKKLIKVSSFLHSQQIRDACLECPIHGKNLACPPHSPEFSKHIASAEDALLIVVRLPLGWFDGATPEERYRRCFKVARGALCDELLQWRRKGYVIAGSGACKACSECALERDESTCIKPDERIYSLESTGVNVIDLTTKALGLEIQWNDEGGGIEILP